MTFGSVCSGIEAASVAWEPLGWKAAWFAEVDSFCSELLKVRYPDVPNYGDFTRITSAAPAIDVLVGGTPCQSFSVAGQRLGMDDPRGNLAIEFVNLARRLRPRWIVWENVPGVLSSWSDEAEGLDRGRWQRNDFDTFLTLLGECGYGTAWRILNAEHFGVPQRRRRVFVIGYLGDWRPAAAVLFEQKSLRGYSPAGRKARQRIAAGPAERIGDGRCGNVADTLTANANQTTGLDSEVVAASTGDISRCLNAGGMGRLDYETETLITHPLMGDGARSADPDYGTPVIVTHTLTTRCAAVEETGSGRGAPLVPVEMPIAFSCKDYGQDADETAPTLRAMEFDGSHANGGGQLAVAYQAAVAFEPRYYLRDECGGAPHDELAPPLRAESGVGDGAPRVAILNAVRRLSPRECERLQGFPSDYSAIRIRGKKLAAEGSRYKALGNSFAVPVVRWIGERIQQVEAAISPTGPGIARPE